jgi:heme exporter protein D
VKSTSTPQSATSLPRAPLDDAQKRMRKYFIMMSVRVICFVLMVVITPYGWYTWVLAVGAVVLPYIAVVVANVGEGTREVRAVPPERQIEAGAPTAPVTGESGGSSPQPPTAPRAS